MSLFTLNTINTPRNRVFGCLKQYINVNATNARTFGIRFLASLLTLIRAPRIENQSAEIEDEFDLRIASGNTSKQVLQGGGPQPKDNPTRTILGNQAIKQEGERICRTKVTIKGRTKACTHKSRNRNKTIRLATTVYDYQVQKQV